MKKTIIAVLLLMISIPVAYAQESVNGPMDKVILDQAHKMGKYFIAKDYEAFAKYTHPTTLELMGGEEKMLEELRRNFALLEAEGVTFLNLTFTAPSQIIVAEEGELQSTLTQMIEMKVVGGTMTVYATVITVSRDGGKNWYFADTAGNDLVNMRKIIPNLSTELVIPEPMEPAFVPDPEK
jgi:hypothetical protein